LFEGWYNYAYLDFLWEILMSKMPKMWMPTHDECHLIKAAAAEESSLRGSQVELQPGRRYNTQDSSAPESINIARVTRETNGGWDDTDLADHDDWTDFKSGVILTEDGRATVDFYIYSLKGDSGLHGNVVVHYAGGKITSIEGFGRVGHKHYQADAS
jgi:hypothetical protein